MKSKKLVYIGISAIVALIILIVGVNFLKGINLFHTSNYYFVSYESVTGLNISAPVTANGFKVGQVREMKYEYDNPGHIKVELALDPALKIPEGTVAVLGADLLGTATIALEMPKSTQYAKVGSNLEGRQSGGLMDNVQADLMPGLVAVLPKVDSLLQALTAVVTDPSLHAALDRLDNISADLNVLSSNLAAAAKPLPGVVNQASVTMNNLTDMSERLDSLSATVNRLPLEQTMANVESVSANLKELTAQLQSKDSSLGMLVNDPGLYNNLNATVASLDSLIVDVKRQPKRYLKFSVF
ncbi:MAG: MlaD family protein [Muribaculaceae bacterium]|nr:MlaD family protein [Muribaculaceae bacterium]MDE7111810.1 MlaD family protein [Muribaculaceae bacterium]